MVFGISVFVFVSLFSVFMYIMLIFEDVIGFLLC